MMPSMMMRRILALGLFASFACTAEHASGQVVTIGAALAKSKGLPPLGFSLDFTGTAFTVSPFPDGRYLYASGPPDDPLGLRISPSTRDHDLAEAFWLLGSVVSENKDAEVVVEVFDVLGTERPVVAWITGEGSSRISWCAFIVGPEMSGDALLIEAGVGHSGPDITCKTALGHDELAKVIASLRFEWAPSSSMPGGWFGSRPPI